MPQTNRQMDIYHSITALCWELCRKTENYTGIWKYKKVSVKQSAGTFNVHLTKVSIKMTVKNQIYLLLVCKHGRSS